MKKMKVIELLDKIANGETQTNTEFYYKDEKYIHIDNLFGDYYVEEILNDEVEIIEEDKKIPTLKNLNLTKIDINKAGQVYGVTKKEMIADIQTLQKWINKIIDYINKEEK